MPNTPYEPGLQEKIMSIGSVSAAFTEIGAWTEKFINESAEFSSIKKVTRKDVTGKHFVNWFFKMDDFANITPEEFPLYMITHNDEYAVYGYFNNSMLDGIIRVDEEDDAYFISFFFVNAECQNQGIGQYLFRSVLNCYKDKKLILHVYTNNNRAIHIYQKHGFKIVGKEHGRGYLPHLLSYVMQKDANDKHVFALKEQFRIGENRNNKAELNFFLLFF
jgi:ribosomal protein S18 acetylase RimI-like enzyme